MKAQAHNMPDQKDKIATALYAVLETEEESNRNLEPANVVDGLFAIARALDRCANALTAMGVGDAVTPMGAIEFLAKEIHDGFSALADKSDL